MIIESDLVVKNPKVSVVIATYNQVRFIEETVMSAINQETDFPYEVIVADDGSNDGERDLLQDIQKRYPEKLRLIFNEKNMMVTRNYINAFREARGEYVATIDGDDIWTDKRKIQKQADILDSIKDVSLVHTGYQSFNSETQDIIATINTWDSPMSLESGLKNVENYLLDKYSCYPLGSSSFFRKSQYFENIDKYEKLINDKYTVGEGTLLNVMMSFMGKYMFLPDLMVKYRVVDSSLSHFETKEKVLEFKVKLAGHKTLAAICSQLPTDSVTRIIRFSWEHALQASLLSRQYSFYKTKKSELLKYHRFGKVFEKEINKQEGLFAKTKVFVKVLVGRIKK